MTETEFTYGDADPEVQLTREQELAKKLADVRAAYDNCQVHLCDFAKSRDEYAAKATALELQLGEANRSAKDARIVLDAAIADSEKWHKRANKLELELEVALGNVKVLRDLVQDLFIRALR